MKRLIFLFSFFLCSSILLNAQELKVNASYIKDNYPDDYKKTIRKMGTDEWGDDFNMVVYEINKQADALVKLIDEFKSEHSSIARKAIIEWSLDGYANSNSQKFNEIKTFNLKSLLKLHCNWNMVKYEYDKQVKAKSAF